MTRVAVNGIELYVEEHGGGPALLLLHGFTGDHTTWDSLAPRLEGFRVLRPDVIGHGRSDSPGDWRRYSMAHAVDDLRQLLSRLGIGEYGLLGYSMGGRLALHLALADHERVRCLVLESASPGIEDEDERRARVDSDEALALSIERDGLAAFADAWQAQPLFASQARLPAGVLARQRSLRLSQSTTGLANSLRGMGAGRQQWLLPRLGELKIPALVIAGALDAKYAALAPLMASTMANASLEIVPDAGHAVHLEQPGAFTRSLLAFLRANLAPDGAGAEARTLS